MSNLSNILNFLLYFGSSVALLAAFLAAYTLMTSIREWDLIRSGNNAVAISLGGAMIGFALPLASAIMHTQSLKEAIITAAIALVVQLLCAAAMRLLRPDGSNALARGDMAEGVFRASTAIVIGILNAACLS